MAYFAAAAAEPVLTAKPRLSWYFRSTDVDDDVDDDLFYNLDAIDKSTRQLDGFNLPLSGGAFSLYTLAKAARDIKGPEGRGYKALLDFILTDRTQNLSVRNRYSDAQLEAKIAAPLTEEECKNHFARVLGGNYDIDIHTFYAELEQLIECLNSYITESVSVANPVSAQAAEALAWGVGGVHDFLGDPEARHTLTSILERMIKDYPTHSDALKLIKKFFTDKRLYLKEQITISQEVCREMIVQIYALLGVPVDYDRLNVLKVQTDILKLTHNAVDIIAIMDSIKKTPTRTITIEERYKSQVTAYLQTHHKLLYKLCDEMYACGGQKWNIVQAKDAFKERFFQALLLTTGVTIKNFPNQAHGPFQRDPMGSTPSDNQVFCKTEINLRAPRLQGYPDLSVPLRVLYKEPSDDEDDDEDEYLDIGSLPPKPGIFGPSIQCDWLSAGLTYMRVDWALEMFDIDGIGELETYLDNFIQAYAGDDDDVDTYLMSIKFVYIDGILNLLSSIAPYGNKLSVDGVCKSVGIATVRGDGSACDSSTSSQYIPPHCLANYIPYIQEDEKKAPKKKKGGTRGGHVTQDKLTTIIYRWTLADKQSGDAGAEILAQLLKVCSIYMEKLAAAGRSYNNNNAPGGVFTGDLASPPASSGLYLLMSSVTQLIICKRQDSKQYVEVNDENIRSIIGEMTALAIEKAMEDKAKLVRLRRIRDLTQSEQLFYELTTRVNLTHWFTNVYDPSMLGPVNNGSLNRNLLFKFPNGLKDYCSLLSGAVIDTDDIHTFFRLSTASYEESGPFNIKTFILHLYETLDDYTSDLSVSGTDSLHSSLLLYDFMIFNTLLQTELLLPANPPPLASSSRSNLIPDNLRKRLIEHVKGILDKKIEDMYNDLLPQQDQAGVNSAKKRQLDGGGFRTMKRRKTRRRVKTNIKRVSRKTINNHAKSEKHGTRKKTRRLPNI